MPDAAAAAWKSVWLPSMYMTGVSEVADAQPLLEEVGCGLKVGVHVDGHREVDRIREEDGRLVAAAAVQGNAQPHADEARQPELGIGVVDDAQGVVDSNLH